MEAIESEGKSVAEAVESALKRAGLRRDQVEVQILQEASSGFLGLGARLARVRLTEKRWGAEGAPRSKEDVPAVPGPLPLGQAPRHTAASSGRPPAARRPEHRPARGLQGQQRPHRGTQSERQAPAAASRPVPAPSASALPQGAANPEPPPVDTARACSEAEALLKDTLGLIGLSEVSLKSSWDNAQERVKISVEGPQADRLIGDEGRTLESLQLLLTLMLGRRLEAPVAAQVDVMGYWQKREHDILSQAQKGVDEVKSTGRPFRMAPMEPAMRRLVHRTLADHPDVVTASEGDGAWRKIVIRPRKS